MLDRSQRSQRPDLRSLILLLYTPQFRDVTNVEHVFRLEQLLVHGGNEVSPAGQNADVLGVLRQVAGRFFHRARPQQLELWEAQSSPPASAGISRRAGSSGWRSGPLPRNHSAPPCSRKRSGAVGSTPSVRFRGFAFLLARRAARTRSGVKGHSCNRIPTAS